MSDSPDPVGPRAVAGVGVDHALLAVAIVAVSTSAPLIRYAAAPALAIAFWRNVLALPVLAPAAWRQRHLDRRARRLIALAGVLLAAHFAVWIPSISYTSVASSVALVATQPVWAALIARRRGEDVSRAVWSGIGVALVGVAILTGVDFSLSSRALFGDLLALLGGMFAAGYVAVGAEVRRSVGTAVYAWGCYATAAATLLVVCLASGRSLTGYDTGTWLALGALVVGPQLLGHTLVNLVLRSITATAVSVAILFEIIGAALIAAVAFDETPPIGAAPAAVLILTGVVMVIRAGRQASNRGLDTTRQPPVQ